MKFQRFNTELKYNNKTLLNDLHHKINSDLQWAMLNEWIMNLNEFTDICMQVDVKLTELNIQSAAQVSAISITHSVANTSSACTSILHLTSSVLSWKKFKILNLNFNKKELMQKELCFKCKKIEHKAY